jgi:hypothetical protein
MNFDLKTDHYLSRIRMILFMGLLLEGPSLPKKKKKPRTKYLKVNGHPYHDFGEFPFFWVFFLGGKGARNHTFWLPTCKSVPCIPSQTLMPTVQCPTRCLWPTSFDLQYSKHSLKSWWVGKIIEHGFKRMIITK